MTGDVSAGSGGLDGRQRAHQLWRGVVLAAVNGSRPRRRRASLPTTACRASLNFFGMTIHMYWFDTQKHRQPHFHVRYRGMEAVFALDGRVIEGRIGARADRLIAEWREERRSEFQEAWAYAAQGRVVTLVMPLH